MPIGEAALVILAVRRDQTRCLVGFPSHSRNHFGIQYSAGVAVEGAAVEGAAVEGAVVEGAVVEGAAVEGAAEGRLCTWSPGILLAVEPESGRWGSRKSQLRSLAGNPG